MSRNKKTIMIVTLVLGFVLLTVGVSFALMNYNRIGSNHQVVLGDIWMSYEETTTLTIEDAVPGSDYSNYFEFQISGKNTYTKKDIYYDFSLVRGDLPAGKTEDNRIPDKYLKFKLVSVDSSNQETVIFTDETYENLENQRIYVETIKKNTENKINRKYRLYMTIDNSLEIGNLETAVFTMDEWESAFATVKLNVTGDFSEKKIVTYEDCFETRELSDETLEITDYYKYDPSSTDELYQNQLCTSDVVIPSQIYGKNVTDIGYGAFNTKQLISVVIPDGVCSIGAWAFANNELLSISIPNSVTYIDVGAFNNNKLSVSDSFIYSRIDDNYDDIAEIDTTTIISYAGLDKNPVIPDGVRNIGQEAFYNTNILSVVIPDSVNFIGSSAFANNQLTSVIIPDGVITIDDFAFSHNVLERIILGESVEEIGIGAFSTYLPNWGDNEIQNVINKSGKSFDWDSIFEQESIDGNNYFETGTYKYYFNDELVEILIQDASAPTPENCFEVVHDPYVSISVITSYDATCGPDVVIPTEIEDATVTEIDSWVFQNKGLKSVVLPNTLEKIGKGAFSENNLVSVVIPDSVTVIGETAFAYNYLDKVVIGASVNVLENSFPTHSNSYAGNNKITKVVNKGNFKNWESVFGLEASDSNVVFRTGYFNFYYNGDQTIEITDVED